jgi:hypothetical protein
VVEEGPKLSPAESVLGLWSLPTHRRIIAAVTWFVSFLLGVLRGSVLAAAAAIVVRLTA